MVKKVALSKNLKLLLYIVLLSYFNTHLCFSAGKNKPIAPQDNSKQYKTKLKPTPAKALLPKSDATKVYKFATIRSNQANARVGPGLQYPVSLLYIKKSEPIKILQESNHWRQIIDIDGDVSWIHVSLLSRKRSVIVKSSKPIFLLSSPFSDANCIAHVASEVRCDFLNYCSTKFCKVKCSSHKGWIERKSLWGINDNEFTKENKLMLYFKSLF